MSHSNPADSTPVRPHPLLALIPGLLLAAALAVVSIWASDWIGVNLMGFSKSPISPVMVVIILGIVIGNVFTLPAGVKPGLQFAMKKLLRLGIILLGIRLSIGDVFQLGALGIPIVLLCVASALLFTTWLNRRLHLPERLGTLIAVGTSICGVTAIVATAPAIEAEDEEIAYAVGVITLFGILAMMFYPYLAYAIFDGDPVKAGMFLGTAIHETAQVAGAGVLFADVFGLPRGLDVATVAKLVRNVFMAAVIPLMAFVYARRSQETAAPGAGTTKGASSVRFWSLFPRFILGFLALAVLRTIGDAGIDAGGRAFGFLAEANWSVLCNTLKEWAVYFMVVALSGVGLMTRLESIRRLGIKPMVVGLGAALMVGGVSAAAILLLGV